MFEYLIDGIRVNPQAPVIDTLKIDEKTLPSMLFRGLGYPRDRFPLQGIDVQYMPIIDADEFVLARIDSADEHSGTGSGGQNSLEQLGESTLEALKRSILRIAAGSRPNALPATCNVGVLLSGGLDSAAIIVACNELARERRLASVTAFHYYWPSIEEVQEEARIAQKVCDSLGVACVLLDQSGVNLEDLLGFYSSLAMPEPQAFLVQLADAKAAAAARHVELLLSGVGSELYFVNPAPFEVDPTPDGSWKVTLAVPSSPMAEWATEASIAERDIALSCISHDAGVDQADRRGRLMAYQDAILGQAPEVFHFTRFPSDNVTLGYPFLSPELLRFSVLVPAARNIARVGAEVLNKAVLRVALGDRLPLDVVVRPSGSPYEAIEQCYLRDSWHYVQKYWEGQSKLALLGLVEDSKLQALAKDRREYMLRSTFTLPLMLVEHWLRTKGRRATCL